MKRSESLINQSTNFKPRINTTCNRAVNNLIFRPSYIKAKRAQNRDLHSRGSSVERVYFSKFDHNSSMESPYLDRSNYQSGKNFVAVSRPINLNSSFDPRTHSEISLKGKYDYYKFGNQDLDKTAFERNFDNFFDKSQDDLKEIDKLNTSGNAYNSEQISITHSLQKRLKDLE